MRKIFLLLICCVCFLTGCTNTAKSAVEQYMSNYNNISDDVIVDMQKIIDREDLTDEQKKVYKDIFVKQYSDLTYEIVSENYEADEAVIGVKISVYDLYKANVDATKYLEGNADEFNDDSGNYSVSKFIDYKLNLMQSVSDRVEYTIDFYVIKGDNGWQVSSLSNADLEKIHGIYDYVS